MKVRPFLPERGSRIFIATLILAQPFWVLEVYANISYFHGGSNLFVKTRPWEALFRDPWWLFASAVLFWKIKTQYEMSLKEIVKISPRFGIMMLAAFLSVLFFVLDIVSTTNQLKLDLPSGINPFWKVSSVFKCLMDCVILDDFKTAVDRLRAYKISRIGSFSQDTPAPTREDGEIVRRWEEIEANAQHRPGVLDFGDDTWVTVQGPTDAPSAWANPGHRRASQIDPGSPWSPGFDDRHIDGVMLGETHKLEDIVPSVLEDTPVQRLEPSHPRVR